MIFKKLFQLRFTIKNNKRGTAIRIYVMILGLVEDLLDLDNTHKVPG